MPKFSGVGVVTDVQSEQQEDEQEVKISCDENQRSTPTKSKTSAVRTGDIDGLRSLAVAMHNKNNVKERELRLRCIALLPDSDMKTSLLWEFLQPTSTPAKTCGDDDSVRDSTGESSKIAGQVLEQVPSSADNLQMTKVSIVDLVNEPSE